MAVPPPPLQSLTPELKLTLQERMESVLIRLMQMNSQTIFFCEAPLFSAFRDRLGYNRSKAGDPSPLELGRNFLQCFRETIPLTLYDAYEPFVSRFFENSPRSSSVRDLLSPGFPDFIAQTSGTSGSTVKSFPRYPITENGQYIPKGIRFCGFSSLRVSGAVKIVNEEGDLQRELPVTIIGSGIMRRRMGVELKDDDKVMSQTRSFFFLFKAISCRIDYWGCTFAFPQPPFLRSPLQFGTSRRLWETSSWPCSFPFWIRHSFSCVQVTHQFSTTLFWS